jgi:hypothetical protein
MMYLGGLLIILAQAAMLALLMQYAPHCTIQ